ncbi:MAG: DUF2877 domain-containing protein, partial [Anaerolineales bacterium]|nr:DUF2877 domain-containing protein [Anaerolineales bacterium]
SSRGFFVRLLSDWVVFISKETYPGPLTLNLTGGLTPPDQPNPGDPVRFTTEAIEFPSTGWTIRSAASKVWTPLPASAIILPLSERRQRLAWVVEQALARRTSSPYSAWLSWLLNLPASPSGKDEDLWARLLALQSACREQDPAEITSRLSALLGWGSGLTPNGDDLSIGLLLALKRWGDRLTPKLVLSEISTGLIASAYRASPLLSANLIECAAAGEADERLLLALDSLVSGQASREDCLEALLGWGYSSGLDVLCGMTFIIG